MKILLTGSAGFIGSNFVRHCHHVSAKHQISSIDKLLYPHCKKNIYFNKYHNFYIGDIADKHLLSNIFEIELPDVVIHMAAESHVDHSINTALPFINSNVVGTQNIIDHCVKYNTLLFYISTDEVYGQLFSEDETPWIEESNLNPRNPYSASKLAGEFLVKAAHETHGLQYLISRSCNNMGPRQSTRNLIPKIIKHILKKENVPIYGQGAEIRSWIHVFDHCSAILHLLEKGVKNQTYNIGTSWEMSNLELFHQICSIMESGHDLLTFVPNRAGHDFRYAVNSQKLRETGWRTQYSFKSALLQTVTWFQNNSWALND